MAFQFTKDGIAFLQAIYAKGDELLKIIGDYARLANKVDTLNAGPGVKVNNPARGSISISAMATGNPRRTNADGSIWIKITGNSQDGTNKRWKYAWSQVAKTTASFGGWTVVSGGLSGTTSNNIAYNTVEDMNGATGTYGNGVASTNLTGSFALVVAPNNLIIRAWPVTVGTTNEWHFFYANGVDGAC